MPVFDQPGRLVRNLIHPRTTVRGRLTLIYGGLFLASGVVLLAMTYLLVEHTFPAVNQGTIGTGSNHVSGVVPNERHGPLTPAATASLVDQLRNIDLHHLLVDSSIALGVMAVISIGLGWLVAGRVLRPLRVMTTTTRHISEDNLHQRLALEGRPDELKDLSDTIDELLTRLEVAFDAQRRFVANASHELRTPLTVTRTLLEMVLSDPDATVESYRAVCQDVLETGEQQEQLIEALLTLARSQRGLDHYELFDLAVVTSEAAAARQATASALGLHLDVSVHAAPLCGDPRLVERLVTNLVENALHYNLPNGNVGVTVDTQDGQATLKVSNTGPLVPPDQLDRMLRPFQRLTSDPVGQTDGLGLGLSIVQAVATAHRASLSLQSLDTGGLKIEVRFQPLTRTSFTDREGRSMPHGPDKARIVGQGT